MIKFFKNFFIILIFPILVMGCNKNISIKNPITYKPSLNFYTENLIKTLKSNKNFEISIFYPKTGKNKSIPQEYIQKFNLFIESLKSNYFIDPNTINLNTKNPEYRLTIFINDKESFVINILNNNFLTIHPWDGLFEADLIDISKLQDGINLYNIVDFLIKNNI